MSQAQEHVLDVWDRFTSNRTTKANPLSIFNVLIHALDELSLEKRRTFSAAAIIYSRDPVVCAV